MSTTAYGVQKYKQQGVFQSQKIPKIYELIEKINRPIFLEESRTGNISSQESLNSFHGS